MATTKKCTEKVNNPIFLSTLYIAPSRDQLACQTYIIVCVFARQDSLAHLSPFVSFSSKTKLHHFPDMAPINFAKIFLVRVWGTLVFSLTSNKSFPFGKIVVRDSKSSCYLFRNLHCTQILIAEGFVIFTRVVVILPVTLHWEKNALEGTNSIL